MRLFIAAVALATLPVAAFAQATPAPAGRGSITRDQFIQQASAKAAQHFDAIDTEHTGTITRAQAHAWRKAHKGGRNAVPD